MRTHISRQVSILALHHEREAALWLRSRFMVVALGRTLQPLFWRRIQALLLH